MIPSIKPVKKPKNICAEKPATLDQFQNAFIYRMEDVVGKRISRKVSKINRRLDSLARLLERNQICVAVRYDPIFQQIRISSNKVFQTSYEENQSTDNIAKLMSLLASH